jgi:hypothetical protein
MKISPINGEVRFLGLGHLQPIRTAFLHATIGGMDDARLFVWVTYVMLAFTGGVCLVLAWQYL